MVPLQTIQAWMYWPLKTSQSYQIAWVVSRVGGEQIALVPASPGVAETVTHDTSALPADGAAWAGATASIENTMTATPVMAPTDAFRNHFHMDFMKMTSFWRSEEIHGAGTPHDQHPGTRFGRSCVPLLCAGPRSDRDRPLVSLQGTETAQCVVGRPDHPGLSRAGGGGWFGQLPGRGEPGRWSRGGCGRQAVAGSVSLIGR